MYLRQKDVAIIFYDVNEDKTLNSLNSWSTEARENGIQNIIIIASNPTQSSSFDKIDVSEGQQMAQKLGASFIDASAFNINSSNAEEEANNIRTQLGEQFNKIRKTLKSDPDDKHAVQASIPTKPSPTNLAPILKTLEDAIIEAVVSFKKNDYLEFAIKSAKQILEQGKALESQYRNVPVPECFTDCLTSITKIMKHEIRFAASGKEPERRYDHEYTTDLNNLSTNAIKLAKFEPTTQARQFKSMILFSASAFLFAGAVFFPPLAAAGVICLGAALYLSKNKPLSAEALKLADKAVEQVHQPSARPKF